MGTRFDTKNQIEPLNTSDQILLNTSDSSDGIVLDIFEFRLYSQGYPGNLVCSVTYTLSGAGEVGIEMTGVTDQVASLHVMLCYVL